MNRPGLRSNDPRLTLLAFAAAGAALAVVLTRFPPDRYAFYPACPFHALTGLECPGCGGTRALAALVRGDVAAAWHANALIVAALPVLMFVSIQSWRKGRVVRVPPGAGYAGLGIALAFAVWRNLA